MAEVGGWLGQKCETLSEKQTQIQRAGVIVQGVERLLTPGPSSTCTTETGVWTPGPNSWVSTHQVWPLAPICQIKNREQRFIHGWGHTGGRGTVSLSPSSAIFGVQT
jgi:hypothetical protein